MKLGFVNFGGSVVVEDILEIGRSISSTGLYTEFLIELYLGNLEIGRSFYSGL